MTSKPYKDKIVPYDKDYRTLGRWRQTETVLLYFIALVSVATPLLTTYFSTSAKTLNLLQFLNYLLIVSYYVINVVIDIFLYPSTANQRRINFLDNSLGTKLLGKDAQHYFDNDDIKNGPYKILVNCFENCFFTYNLSKAMRPQMVVKNSFFGLGFLVIAYYGISNNSIGLPIVQVFLSSLFLTELIHHLNFVAKLKSLLDKFKEVFDDLKDKQYRKNELANPIRLFLDYETTLAYNKSGLSDKIYHRLKVKLTEEWEELKEYYNIS